MFGKNISRPYRLSDKYFYSKYFQTIHVVWSNTIFTPLHYNLQMFINSTLLYFFVCSPAETLFPGIIFSTLHFQNYVYRHYILNMLWILINLICVLLTLYHLIKVYNLKIYIHLPFLTRFICSSIVTIQPHQQTQ